MTLMIAMIFGVDRSRQNRPQLSDKDIFQVSKQEGPVTRTGPQKIKKYQAAGAAAVGSAPGVSSPERRGTVDDGFGGRGALPAMMSLI